MSCASEALRREEEAEVLLEVVARDEADVDFVGCEEALVWPCEGLATDGGIDEGAGAAAFLLGAMVDVMYMCPMREALDCVLVWTGWLVGWMYLSAAVCGGCAFGCVNVGVE